MSVIGSRGQRKVIISSDAILGEFHFFVLKHPATPNQLLCNYLIWYTATLDHTNQVHVPGEALGVKRKHNITGERGGKRWRQKTDISAPVSEQISIPHVLAATSDNSSAPLVSILSNAKSSTSAPTNTIATSVQVTECLQQVLHSHLHLALRQGDRRTSYLVITDGINRIVPLNYHNSCRVQHVCCLQFPSERKKE